MTGKTIKCSKCDKTLDIPEGVNKIFCLYCSTQNLLTDVPGISEVRLTCLSCGAKNKDEAIFCGKCGTNLQEKDHKYKEMHTYIEPATGNEMVYLPGGTFKMGTDWEYKFLFFTMNNNERPVRSVTVSNFYIGKYAVTNKEYCKYKPSYKKYKENFPAVNVSWDDASSYCQWLSNETGKNYRLPTEAEWEYACRAGTTTEYYWGNHMNDKYCWYLNNSGFHVHPVGQKLPNDWGLYDMAGNVHEWCSDIETAAWRLSRIYRGGGWHIFAGYCRSALRMNDTADSRYSYLGFRLAMTP